MATTAKKKALAYSTWVGGFIGVEIVLEDDPGEENVFTAPWLSVTDGGITEAAQEYFGLPDLEVDCSNVRRDAMGYIDP